MLRRSAGMESSAGRQDERGSEVEDLFDPIVKLSDPLVEVSFPDDEPTIFSALRCNHVDMVKNQIQRGFDLNFRKSGEPFRLKSITMAHRIHTSNYAPLHVATLHCPYQTVQLLIDSGADVNILDDQHRTPLHFAVVANRISILKLLVLKGVDINIQSSSGRSALLEAVINENFDCARELVFAGADLDLTDTKGTSVLHQLCFSRYPNVEFIKFVLTQGCKIDIENKKGATPLIFAATLKQIPLIRLLIDYGANVNHRDNQDYTAIHLAITVQRRMEAGRPNIILYLIHQGADINRPDKNGETLIDKAVKSMAVTSIKLLLWADCPRDAKKIMEHPSITYLFDILPDFRDWLVQELYTPRSLMRLCRERIRTDLQGENLLQNIYNLELPKALKDFLLARDIVPQNFQ